MKKELTKLQKFINDSLTIGIGLTLGLFLIWLIKLLLLAIF